MRFINRNQKQGEAEEPLRDPEAPPPRPMSALIASIEDSVGQFREIDMPRWKYRQIIREGRSPQQAMDEERAKLVDLQPVDEPST